MNQADTRVFAAEILQRGCQALAAHAASTLHERHPDMATRFGADSFADWKTHFAQRFLELAAALRMGEPRIFVARVAWAYKAFQARQNDAELLHASLVAMRDVLADSLPQPARTLAIDIVGEAINSLADTASLGPETGLDARRANDRLALSYLQRVLSGDAPGATDEVLRAVAGGLPIRSAYLGVLIAAEREIGRLWHAGQVSVAEEHLVSFAIQRTMAALLHQSLVGVPNGKTAVFAAIENNAHDIGLRAAADLYQLAGWRTIFLGADVPLEDILAMLDVFAADVLLLGVVLARQLPTAAETIRLVHQRRERKTLVIVGGAAFDDAPLLWETLGADGYAADLAAVEPLGARLAGLRS